MKYFQLIRGNLRDRKNEKLSIVRVISITMIIIIISIIVIAILTLGLYQWLWLRVGTGTWPDIESDTKPKLGSNQLFTHFLLMKHGSGSRNGNMGTRGQFSWNYWKKWLSSWSQENLRLLCCVGSEERTSSDRSGSQERLRQIERAFNKFDLNGDGFLSWEEFLQIGLDRETASRIFSACSKEVRVEEEERTEL